MNYILQQACKGPNCGSLNGWLHSAECFAAHEASCGTINDYDTLVGKLTEEVFNWAEATFPNRKDTSMLLKLYSEIGEMIDSDGDRLEVADVFILLLDYAKRKKIDITAAVRDKLEINKSRTWAMDGNGVMSHVDQ